MKKKLQIIIKNSSTNYYCFTLMIIVFVNFMGYEC